MTLVSYLFLYIVKLGYAGVYLFFLFLLQNIDCGYSLLRIFIFDNFKNLCILHGQVFVMFSSETLAYNAAFNLCVMSTATTISFEPPRGKANNVLSEQVRHKPTCTATESG